MSSNPTDRIPDRVPDRVPTVSPEGPRAPARRPCPPSPSPTEGDTVSEPATPCPTTVSQPWFQTHQLTWTYPTHHHHTRQTHTRTHPCPTCGAPPHARCVTKTGHTTPNHGRRARLAHGVCCHGYGAPGTCPLGLAR